MPPVQKEDKLESDLAGAIAIWPGQLCGRGGRNVRGEVEEGQPSFPPTTREMHSRIRYDKVCPLHGKVSSSEIVSGYEYEPGKYVEIDPAEPSRLCSTTATNAF